MYKISIDTHANVSFTAASSSQNLITFFASTEDKTLPLAKTETLNSSTLPSLPS